MNYQIGHFEILGTHLAVMNLRKEKSVSEIMTKRIWKCISLPKVKILRLSRFTSHLFRPSVKHLWHDRTMNTSIKNSHFLVSATMESTSHNPSISTMEPISNHTCSNSSDLYLHCPKAWMTEKETEMPSTMETLKKIFPTCWIHLAIHVFTNFWNNNWLPLCTHFHIS